MAFHVVMGIHKFIMFFFFNEYKLKKLIMMDDEKIGDI